MTLSYQTPIGISTQPVGPCAGRLLDQHRLCAISFKEGSREIDVIARRLAECRLAPRAPSAQVSPNHRVVCRRLAAASSWMATMILMQGTAVKPTRSNLIPRPASRLRRRGRAYGRVRASAF